ncbi:MAG: ABC transporter permease [Armatimonadetes bacterium]|nr:ABC transporter permease [Armatimonadota bacterium]
MRHVPALGIAREDWVLAGLLLATVVVVSLLTPAFLQPENLLEMSRFFVETGLIALAMAPVIITGGIDLSVGSIVGLSVVVMGLAWRLGHLPPALGVLTGLFTGLLCGLGNGLCVARLRLPPLIVTLATMALYRGLALGLGANAPVSDFPPAYYELGQAYYTIPGGLQVPQQLPILLLVLCFAWLALHRSVLGRYVYAIGHNERAAWFAGVPVARVKMALYAFCGLVSGLAGAIYLSRVATAKADAGTLMELDVITVCVLGGVSITGGRGGVAGTMLGLLIVSSLVRGLTLARVPSEDQKIVLGFVLLLAATVYQLLQWRGGRSGPSGSRSSGDERRIPTAEGE